MSTRQLLIAMLLVSLLPLASRAQGKLRPQDVPTFRLRARVVTVGGKDPAGQTFTFRLGVPGDTVRATGTNWSGPLAFGRPQAEATLKGYPTLYLGTYPVIVHLQVGGVVDPTRIEAELCFDEGGEPVPLSGELFGPSLGILLWREGDKPRAASMAGYNRRYWNGLEKARVPESQRPRHIPIVDRFIGGDDDRLDWQEGLEHLSSVGCNALMLPASRPLREMLLRAGLRRTAWAVYNPPGYAFDFDPKITPEAITTWAEGQAKPYREAGYAPEDMAHFTMSDEPGWYYPQQIQALTASPAALARFRHYLKAQGLTPTDLGAKGWDEVRPLGRSRAGDLPSRRLFYWTTRFLAHDSARHFAACTRALERAFRPGLPVVTNWNFFAGRFYVPGPVANNPDKQSPDSGMGGHDPFEFGRLRGGTMLWTEDWFPDSQAYQCSFSCARLRCAADKSGVQFGGYVIPRTSGDRKDGLLQKVLCLVGSGGKAVQYFVFGPEYNFPGNCYPQHAGLLPRIAEAHRMIGGAEELLWPGKRPRPEVALLAPRSAQVWDAKGVAQPRQIQDATNTNLNGSTVDYLAEVFDLYLALQHANVPVDLVDEDDLSAQGLKSYRVLYVTEPNIPAQGQRGIAEWVRAGGTLVTVSGAGVRDRYDEPCSVLGDLSGIREKPRERLLVANTRSLPDVAKGDGSQGPFTAVGMRGLLERTAGEVRARFVDGSPAVLERAVGRGRVVHFAWLPGLSYWKSSTTTRDRLPVGFSESVRHWVVYPTEVAGVRPPVTVDRPLVEAPLLLSDKGAAVTLLNWTGEPLRQVRVTVRVPLPVRSVQGVRQGRIPFQAGGDRVRFTLPLGGAEVVLIRP